MAKKAMINKQQLRLNIPLVLTTDVRSAEDLTLI